MHYVYVKKGLTALCHRGISGVEVQTLLCPVRSLYTRARDFFPSRMYEIGGMRVRVEAVIFSVFSREFVDCRFFI